MSKGYTLGRKGLDGPPTPTSCKTVRRGQRADSTRATDLKRPRLAIIVAIVRGLVSRSVGEVSPISQESGASLGGYERGSQWYMRERTRPI